MKQLCTLVVLGEAPFADEFVVHTEMNTDFIVDVLRIINDSLVYRITDEVLSHDLKQ
jgi:hypothetical protein